MKFADAEEDYGTARYIIFGVPFEDKEMSFRSGAARAPNAIRDVSYNYESHHFQSGVDLSIARMHDAGNFSLEGAKKFLEKVIEDGKTPIVMGGAHSITPPLVSSLDDDFGVVILDAHMDFRSSYLGSPQSHACTARRIFEMVGRERVLAAGVRSASSEEIKEAKNLGFRHYGVASIKNLADEISFERIYLSIDMDVFDPCHAPGVSNPEPFGAGYEVFDFVGKMAKRVVAMDVVEVCPPHDDGRTALLAAALIREMVAHRERD